MQDFFSQGPTVQAQHRIVENLGWGINIPLDSASYQIEQGQMEYAVESIEHGRALLWSEMRGLRTSVDQLHIVDSGLADRFQVVSQALEGIATTVSQHGAAQLRRGKSGDRGESDAFSCTLKQHHKFQQERQEIISRVRDLPDFRHFLRPAPFETLKMLPLPDRSSSSIIAAGVVTLSSFSTAHPFPSFLSLVTLRTCKYTGSEALGHAKVSPVGIITL